MSDSDEQKGLTLQIRDPNLEKFSKENFKTHDNVHFESMSALSLKENITNFFGG